MITSILETLGSRVLPAHGDQAAAPRLPLCDLKIGEKAKVVELTHQHKAVARRMFDVGFVPGATVTLLRHAPWRDPLIFAVADGEIAVRRRDAHDILVVRNV